MRYDAFMKGQTQVAKAAAADEKKKPAGAGFGDDQTMESRGSHHADSSALASRGWVVQKDPSETGSSVYLHEREPGHKIEVHAPGAKDTEGGCDHWEPEGKVTHVKPGLMGDYLGAYGKGKTKKSVAFADEPTFSVSVKTGG